MQWFKKAMLFAGIGICAIGSVPVQAKADSNQVGTFEGRPVFDNHFEGVDIRDGSNNDSLTQRGANFAAVYDPRTNGMISKIEDQGETNTCWAFATIAAIESNLIKKGYVDSNVNLSENHLAYFFYNRQGDSFGNTTGDANLALNSGGWVQNGGTLQGTALNLATWSGVVNETTSEDNAKGEFQYSNLNAGDCYRSDYKVLSTYLYNYSVEDVKQAITDHGAVASGIYIAQNGLATDGKSYYCPIEDGNHAITIVGWDDNYDRNNFGTVINGKTYKPNNNGAWIVKNSYGSSFGDGGYMYVSYEDKSLMEIVAYDMVPASSCVQNNYQYDGTANPMYSISMISGTSVANVYTAKGSAEGFNEILEAVSVCTYTTNVRYSLQVYTGVTGSKNPTNGKAMFSEPQTGLLTDGGYNRIQLNQPVTLTAGEKYSVVFSMTAADGGSVGLGVEANLSYQDQLSVNWISFSTDVDAGAGYISVYGKWYDYGDATQVGPANKCNLRIKAFTTNTTQKTSYSLSSKSISVSKGGSAKLSLTTNPSSVRRKVTWTSSNKKVATVSSSGKVKGKSYGTATIKAKFVAGSNTKTLSCKVTVGPSKVKNFKVKGAKKKLTITWKKNSNASGYVIDYATEKDGDYKTLATIKSNSKTKYTKKMKKGTYYVKMRPYVTKNGKKLYGSYTSVKSVTVK